jgi:sugar/nucleoside kinase (ribokinase family)
VKRTLFVGDSFNADVLCRWLQGTPLVECLRLGAACGALSTPGLGGTGAQPSLAEAEALVARGR